MKNKDIKNFLKKESLKVEIPDYSTEILNKIEYVKIDPAKVEKKLRYKELIFNKAFLVLSVVIIVVIFVINKMVTLDKSDDINNISKNSVSDIYAKQLTSLASVSSGYSSNNIPLNFQQKIKNNNLEKDSIVNEINPYMLTVDAIFNESKMKYDLSKNNDELYNYENKLVVSYLNEVVFTLYYTETPYEYDDGNDLDEINTTLSGILIEKSNQYRIEGYKEVENDKSEFEMELHYSNSSYIKVSQEIEIDENDYEYEFYQNGNKIKEVAIECEYDDGKVDLEIDNEEYEFVYRNNQYMLNLEDEIITISISDTIITYNFINSTTIIKKEIF